MLFTGNIFNVNIFIDNSDNGSDSVKKDVVEYLGFDDDTEKKKVGRPRLASKETKKKSLIIAGLSFFGVTLLLVFGYGSLFGFKSLNLQGLVNGTSQTSNENVLIADLNPIIKDITIKEGTARKVYLTVTPADASNKKIRYKSSDEEVATVDENGKVTGVSVGNAVITATAVDGSLKSTDFNITVIKDASGKCVFSSLDKMSSGVNYQISCDNAKVKEIQYKVGKEDYEKLSTKKLNDSIKFSKEQLLEKITLKVVYYPNNSKISKYSTKTINPTTTKKQVNGNCSLTIKEVNSNSAKYDITCDNATVNKIAYKIGNGSYVGIDASSLADTVLFEESDVTRVIYFNVEYTIDGSDTIKTITKSSIIQKKN